MTEFAALGLSALLTRALEKHGFDKPTEIQSRTIPVLLEGHDLVGLAETGTGKTAAFLLPTLNRLLENPAALEPGHPRALILAPTRELAQQIGQALNQLSNFIHLRSTVIYGGAPMNKQLNKLKGGIDILIATPGRLMDHMRRGSVNFANTEVFILDEADRMLDMGFVGDVKTIAQELPTPHQTILFSATINKSVEGLSRSLLTEPVRINVVRKAGVSSKIKHSVLHVTHENKRALVKKLLDDNCDGQVIVFTRTKYGADKLSRDLSKQGFSTDAIHGDRNQRQRQRTITRFREGQVKILVATDVAARGIDVPGVACVINYDLPMEAEAYVHRIGRTGRNGAEGKALSLCTHADMGLLRDIERLLKRSVTIEADHPFHVEPPEKKKKPKKKFGRKGPVQKRRAQPAGGKKKTVDSKRTDEQKSTRAPFAGKKKPAKRTKPTTGKPTQQAKRTTGKPTTTAKPTTGKPTKRTKPLAGKPAKRAKPTTGKPATKPKRSKRPTSKRSRAA